MNGIYFRKVDIACLGSYFLTFGSKAIGRIVAMMNTLIIRGVSKNEIRIFTKEKDFPTDNAEGFILKIEKVRVSTVFHGSLRTDIVHKKVVCTIFL